MRRFLLAMAPLCLLCTLVGQGPVTAPGFVEVNVAGTSECFQFVPHNPAFIGIAFHVQAASLDPFQEPAAFATTRVASAVVESTSFP